MGHISERQNLNAFGFWRATVFKCHPTLFPNCRCSLATAPNWCVMLLHWPRRKLRQSFLSTNWTPSEQNVSTLRKLEIERCKERCSSFSINLTDSLPLKISRFAASLGNLPSSFIRIRIPNSDDDYDTISILTMILSRQSRFQSNFDLFLTKIDHFRSLFD